jgi:hypothetical protein
MAEGVRFELTRELAPPAGFQDRCLKPLGHPSSVETLSLFDFGLLPKQAPSNIYLTFFRRSAAVCARNVPRFVTSRSKAGFLICSTTISVF